MNTFFSIAWTTAKQWLGRIALAIVALILLLSLLGIEYGEKFLPVVIVALLMGIYELLVPIHHQTKGGSEPDAMLLKIGTGVDALLARNSSPALLSLQACREQIEAYLNAVPAGEPIKIDHLGLDMSQAWEHLEQILFQPNARFQHIEYRGLVLTDHKGRTWPKATPKEVKDWSAVVSRSTSRIARHLERLDRELTPAGRRQIQFQMRKYNEVPVVHGFHIRQPREVYFVAFCRWRGTQYYWGGNCYISIDENAKDALSTDLKDTFNGYFDHLWDHAERSQNLEVSINVPADIVPVAPR